MKHCSHQGLKGGNQFSDVEFAFEFASKESCLDQEAQHAFLSAKAGGMITKRLVEVGEKMLMNQQKMK